MAKENRLTTFELAVCQEYFANGGNKSAAFRKHHKSAARWKDNTVWTKASALFAKPSVKAYLTELNDRAKVVAQKKFDITAERVLQAYACVAFADIRKMFVGNDILLPADIPDVITGAVSSIEVVTKEVNGEVERVHKFRLNDRLKALEFLSRYLAITADGEGGEDFKTFQGVPVPAWMAELIPTVERKGGD
ncbi:MAG: terminase small subunit [Desulfopila sp.]